MKTAPEKTLTVMASVVIIALTGTAFWLSFAHLAEVALAHGMRGKEVRAWAWPATLDLFIVAGELMWLRAAMLHRVDWWAICLTAAGSLGSIALNVAGVGAQADPLNYVVAAVPPTAALLAFGALMRQIHQALAERAEAVSTIVDTTPEVTATVTLERVEDDQPRALPKPPEVVPAGARMLPIVARPEPEPTFVFDHSRQSWMPSGSTNGYIDWPAFEEPEVVTGPDGEWSPDPEPEGYPSAGTPGNEVPEMVTTAVPADTPREVVTQVIALTPSELRRRATKLNRDLVTSTGRPVTIERLREEYGLSRREATELRREVVTVALVPGEARP
ncbi:DUF2637 domain-containing protein [Streptomyces sp. ME08-AFT2]|uniref:DUF2637 domain-containing protein n=1 Tax=Streptomyces sp. ME08-AFT2 TaxID=3028683 RepID=UPI0029B8F48A|nr:DUF2637 domain-containing protein [Streptomyces sp. ME08-AFT2]MDX3315183.1 DUF2637 domain-containing protein [Streptomyces sp. ME08-AFT2]